MKIERILTDNGARCKSRKFREACREFGIQYKRTRPYQPQNNGKAERFIQTALKEWAYAQTYTHPWKMTAYLSKWTHHYNFVRPHSALGRKPPAPCLKTEGKQRVDTLHLAPNAKNKVGTISAGDEKRTRGVTRKSLFSLEPAKRLELLAC